MNEEKFKRDLPVKFKKGGYVADSYKSKPGTTTVSSVTTPKPHTLKRTVTYSSMSNFLTCRKKYQYRYVENLKPFKKKSTLRFGSIIHSCLEQWHGRFIGAETVTEKIGKSKINDMAYSSVVDYITSEYNKNIENEFDDKRKQKLSEEKCLALAMMEGYVERYQHDNFGINNFEVIAVEKNIAGGIRNPNSGRIRRKLKFEGKVDGLVMLNGNYYLLEHKTAAVIDGAYIERLQGDLQITIYAMYLERIMGIKIVGVIYNILGKVKIRKKIEESVEAFNIRYADLCAKSKNGKSSAKRKYGETDDEYIDRLLRTKYLTSDATISDGLYHREEIIFGEEDKVNCAKELWNITGYMQEAFSNKKDDIDSFYRSRTACNNYHSLCEYFPLCNGVDDEISKSILYEVAEPHEELVNSINSNINSNINSKTLKGE